MARSDRDSLGLECNGVAHEASRRPLDNGAIEVSAQNTLNSRDGFGRDRLSPQGIETPRVLYVLPE